MTCIGIICSQNFNPRSRKGNDYSLALSISLLTHFNPRSREGNDSSEGYPGMIHDNFNPRSRKGNDSSFATSSHHFGDFNPRSRKGNDVDMGSHACQGFISIHVPARGTTQFPTFGNIKTIFQSTYPQGDRHPNRP